MNNLSEIKKTLETGQIQRPMYNVHGLKNKITNIARIAKLP